LSSSSADVSREEVQLLRERIAAMRSQVDAQEKRVASQQAAIARSKKTERQLQAVYLTEAEWAAQQMDYDGALDSMWLLLCGALVMLMHAGFAMLEAGCCRSKNAQNVLMKNLVNVTVGTMGWFFFGWGIAFGGDAATGGKALWIGSGQFLSDGFITHSDGVVSALGAPGSGQIRSRQLDWFFQWAFCTAGATIVSGGVAERVRSPTYAAYAFVMAAFIYPVIVAWTWQGGWLSGIFGVGFMDFAGSGIVHLAGGISALAGTMVLGPRKGRFEHPELFEAHSLPLAVLGTFILWFGWYGFNPGSVLGMHDAATGMLAAQVAMNTTLSAAIGGMTVFVLRYFLTHKYDVGGLCNGILAGLVSITAGCGNMQSGYALLTGLIGGFVYQAGSMLLVKFKIDDPVDASPVHMGCGTWACIAAAWFDWGATYGNYHGWNGWSCMTLPDGSCDTHLRGHAMEAELR
ncbi:unnamed protein product, partial [Polarella glacialis]